MTGLKREDFIGRWRLRKQIDDRHLGQSGEMTGEADLRPRQDGGLDYRESGALRLGGITLEATRAYIWVFEAGQVVVRFTDGKPFHVFTPSGRALGSDHPCGNDYYRVAYDFDRWPNWRATWTVTGPRKDYSSISDYEPA